MYTKKIVILVMILLTAACQNKTKIKTSKRNISGLWTDSNSSNFTNCYVIIAQDGDKINMTHYLEFKGIAMVEYGIGTIKENILNYDVIVTKAIPGWAKKGKHLLTLNNDGTVLKGVYQDEEGKTGPLVFKKIK